MYMRCLMKKTHIIIIALLSLVLFLGLSACRSTPSAETLPNSRDNLDWEGVYIGAIPSLSGPVINVSIRLNYDETFELIYEYMDRPEMRYESMVRQDNIFNWEGSFTWNDTGNLIFLNVRDRTQLYRVAENTLIRLDMDGNEISDGFMDNYIFRKAF